MQEPFDPKVSVIIMKEIVRVKGFKVNCIQARESGLIGSRGGKFIEASSILNE